MRLRILCPAKVNTFLAVGPPDTTGYHPIRSTFQAVGLFDELEIEVTATDSLEVVGATLPIENTLTKALRLAREQLFVRPLALRLTKRIPSEAGLGGGSSDAAGLIRGLAHLLREPMDGFLTDVAQAVGADVAFFLVGGRARAEGYGERLTPLPDLALKWLLLAKPDEGVPTAVAYQGLDAQPRPFHGFDHEDQWFNDFERIAPCSSLEMSERLRVFGAAGAMLTGSGSAVFGVFGDEGSAREAETRLRGEFGSWTAVAPTLTRAESLAIQRS